MEKRIHSRLVPILVLGAALASVAMAQTEQWLQYHSANEIRQMIPDTGYQYLQNPVSRPENVKVPAFKSDRPLFWEWKTTMVPSGRMWMAFDKSNPKGDYDRLYLDAN